MPSTSMGERANDQEGLKMLLSRLDQLEQYMKNGFQQVNQHLQGLDKGQEKND
jgi:hypothetical protein